MNTPPPAELTGAPRYATLFRVNNARGAPRTDGSLALWSAACRRFDVSESSALEGYRSQAT